MRFWDILTKSKYLVYKCLSNKEQRAQLLLYVCRIIKVEYVYEKIGINMKAAIRFRYGPPDVISIETIEIPTPKENEMLIKVHATTVNRTDCAILSGKPFVMRYWDRMQRTSICRWSQKSGAVKGWYFRFLPTSKEVCFLYKTCWKKEYFSL